MLLIFLLAAFALVVAAVSAGVLYVSQDSRRASIHLDKQRLREVRGEAKDVMAEVVRTTKQAARNVRDSVIREEPRDEADSRREKTAV